MSVLTLNPSSRYLISDRSWKLIKPKFLFLLFLKLTKPDVNSCISFLKFSTPNGRMSSAYSLIEL